MPASSKQPDDFLVGASSSEESENLLDLLGADLAKKRDEAVTARKESGIEDIWQACEEAYLCIDDTNRGEYTGNKWVKPTGMTGGITAKSDGSKKESTVFVRLTPRYVDMGSAKVCDRLLPIDDKAFSLDPTPIPDLVLQKKDLSQVMHPASQQPMTRAATPDEMAAMNPPPQPGSPPPQVPLTVADLAQQASEQAHECAKKAETRIYDWMTECGYPAEMRKLIHDSARIGVGVLKSPVPVIQKSQAITREGNVVSLQVKNKVVPAAQWKDPWNIFPHAACGEDINDGDHIFDRDFLSSTQLKQLKKDKTYLPDQIDKVLEEGPGKCLSEGQNQSEVKNKHRFEVWYFTGTIKRSEMMLTNAIGKDELPDEVDDVYAICTLINDTVIRAILNPMESGSFGYHAMPWSRRAGHWAGVGVTEQVSMPQRMVNSGTRALLNNGGLSAGIQLIIDPIGLVAADGQPTITPNKLWYKTKDAIVDDVNKLFGVVEFPNVGEQLMAIINYGFKLAEEACNIPLISQGQTGPNTPETFGGMELQDTNANTLLRSIAISVDDHITAPTVNGFYEWLLLDPNVPDEEKGDFKINAKGSLAMVEKAIQEQTMAQIGAMILNPAYRGDPKKWFAEFLRTKRLDPRKIQYTEAEQEKMDEAPPVPPIQLQVAQANATAKTQQIQTQGQVDIQIEQAKAQGEMQLSAQEMQQEQSKLANGQASPHMAMASARVEEARIRANAAGEIEASRAQTELAYAQNEAQMARDNANARIQELQLKRELAILDYTSKHNLTIEQVQGELAKTAMQERTKRELAAADLQMQQNEGDKQRAHEAGRDSAGAETTSKELTDGAAIDQPA